MKTPLLQARDIEFRRRDGRGGRDGGDGFRLGVSGFELTEGESVALVGPNGSGKTTFLKILAGLERPDRGEVIFDSCQVRSAAEKRAYHRQIAYIPQSLALYNTTVFENVAIGLRIRHVAKSEIRARVEGALEKFGIGGLAGRSAQKISGGEARRVMLARALVLEPRLLFMDEPFGELDLPVKEEILTELAGALAGLRCAKLIVTHDHEEALRLGERFVVMVGGAIVQTGTAADIFNLPATAEVAAFVGVKNVLEGTAVSSEGGMSQVQLGAGASLLVAGEFKQGQTLTLCVPPESVVLTSAEGEAAALSARNLLKGTVTGLMPFRYGFWVKLDCGFPLSVCVTRQAISSLGVEIGAKLHALIKATAVHVIEHAH
ncbi:MAG: ABC transporter ATP-binding protein [Planctomycetota bacterium]|nr:ABC transporter ATP-binding protein [Planctomycetota bacterium]